MPIDSTADLLFRIGANTDDGEANIQRFRALLGKDLGELSTEFSDWATKVFGNLTTVTGALTAAAAAGAAAVVAVAAAANHAADEYAAYVSEVERGSRITGISTENMSGLHLMAEETGVSYDSLTRGLARFASNIVAANEKGGEHMQMFARLGISQAQVKAGEKDMLPVLELVMDKMHQLGAGTRSTAAAKELLRDRTGELTRMLGLGSEALEEFKRKAKDLGLVITSEDVKKVEEYRATVAALKSETEALETVTGRVMLPIKRHWEVTEVAILKTVAATLSWKKVLLALEAPAMGPLAFAAAAGMVAKFVQDVRKNYKEIEEETEKMAKALAKLGGGGPPPGNDKIAKEKADYAGVSEVLTEIQTKMADLAGPQAKAADEAERLRDRLDEARQKLEKQFKAGEVSQANFEGQMQDMRIAAVLLPQLTADMAKKAGDAVLAAVRETAQQLQAELLKQGPQTLAVKQAEWAAEMAAKRAAIVARGKAEGADETANLELLDQLEIAGARKIADDAGRERMKGEADLAAKVAAQGERTHAARVAQLDREIADMRAAFEKEGQITQQQADLLAQYRKNGLDKIAAEEKAAYDSEKARLGEQLERIDREHQTAEQRIAAQYQADVAKYTAAEEKKTLATATSEAQRAAIQKQFAAIRTGLYQKEQQDLLALKNSQGWQGVFGAQFAQMIRGNEALSKEWADRTKGSTLMVQVALESMKEMAQQAFQEMANGMGQAIAQGIVYEKSIGKAMEASLKATLASLSAQAYAHAIYSLGLGFLDLAEQDYPGAAAAFEAAGLFAILGTAAGFAGRAIPGGGSGASGGSGSAGNGASAGGAGGASGGNGNYGTAAGASGPHITVNVYGHVVGTSGVAEFAGMLNDAVLNQGVTLTATNTTTGRQIQQ